MIVKQCFLICTFFIFCQQAFSQQKHDSTGIATNDSALRIKNLNPFFTLHVDSTLRYQLEINKNTADYYWFLKEAPVGLRINKDNGLLTFKADKSFFLSGRLKYDLEYRVLLRVQNLEHPEDYLDTTFKLLFYNTEITPSKVKPTVTKTLFVDEGDTISFKIQCENGNFPIEDITYVSNYPIKSLTQVQKCNDDFTWSPSFDFVKETDKDRQKVVDIYFIGTNKFYNRDTASITIIVRENINYPFRIAEYEKLKTEIDKYIVQLKSSFRLVDKKIRKNKSTRTTFDLASASTALGGTIFSSMPGTGEQTTGKILPSVGVALVPVKEATAPNNNYDQNMATLIRSGIKRLEYLLADNMLISEKDPDILNKTRKLKEELKQTQIQLIDIPLAIDDTSAKELDEYFNNPKVNKKYRVRQK